MRDDRRGLSPIRGFTVIELLAVVAIIAALATIAIPQVQNSLDRANVARAIGDIHTIQTELDGQDTLPDNLSTIGRSGMLDPWGNAYVYLKFPQQAHGHPQGARKDRFLVPINSLYDLYSMGKDGSSVAALTAKASQDDVLRANDGAFIGLASQF